MERPTKKIILYIDCLSRRGAQRVMTNLADHFSQRGHQVILVNDFPLGEDTPVYSVSKDVYRYYLQNENSGSPIIKNIERILRLRKLVQKERPDIILSFLGKPNIRMLIATMGIKIPKYVSVRNDPNKEYAPSGLKKWLSRKLFDTASGCIFQTEDAAMYFSEKLIQRSKVIFNPVADQFFHIERAEETHNVVTFGRMEKQKNHQLLLDAFKTIAEEFPHENLIIYGDGPLRNQLIESIQKLEISKRVILPGNVPDVGAKLAQAKVFVLSSNYEGMPNALMEALAAGVPCISTDCPCGGPKMLIQNNINGLLVSVNNSEELAGALHKLLSNVDFREEIGKQAREKALAFQPAAILSEWDAYLESV